MGGLTENLQGYKDISNEHGTDGIAYAIINLMNDLIRLDSSRKGDYFAEATQIFRIYYSMPKTFWAK